MNNKNTLLLVMSVLMLSGCSYTSGLFGGDDDDEVRLEGKRISVLELEKSLQPETKNQEVAVADSWNNANWPQAGGYPNHSMQNLSLAKDVKRAWRADIGSGRKKGLPLTAKPVVAEGKVFTLDTNSEVRAFSVDKGKEIWDADIENDDEDETVISGGLSYANGVVFVTNGFDEIIALSAANGETLWRTRLPSPSRAAPTIMSGRVFVTTLDNRVVTLAEDTGKVIWEYVGISEAAGLLGAASPAANSDIVVPVFSSGEVSALRLENGSVAWSDNLTNVRSYGGGLEGLSDIKAYPIIDQSKVLAVSYGGKMVALDERSGTRIWQKDIGSTETPWVAGATAFILSSDSQLIALNLDDGRITWVTPLPRYEDEEDKEDPIRWSGPVMGSGRLILVGTHGHIIEIMAKDGSIVREWDADRSVSLAPVIASNTLFILGDDGTLMAFR